MSSSCLSSVMFALMFAISVLFYAAKIGAFNAEMWHCYSWAPRSSLGVHTVGSRDWKENKSFTIIVINPSPSIQRQRDWFAVCLLGLGFFIYHMGRKSLFDPLLLTELRGISRALRNRCRSDGSYFTIGSPQYSFLPQSLHLNPAYTESKWYIVAATSVGSVLIREYKSLFSTCISSPAEEAFLLLHRPL